MISRGGFVPEDLALQPVPRLAIGSNQTWQSPEPVVIHREIDIRKRTLKTIPRPMEDSRADSLFLQKPEEPACE